jgi:hypothetical protein
MLPSNDVLMGIIIPLWCIRDMLRVITVYIEDQITNNINLMVRIVCLLILTVIPKDQNNILKIIFTFSAIPVVVNASVISRLKIRKINIVKFAIQNVNYGSKNAIEMLISMIIWQAPTILLYNLGLTNLSLTLSKLTQVLNLPATVIRITTLMISKRYREGDHFNAKSKIFLFAGLVTAFGCIIITQILYPADNSIDKINYNVFSTIIYLGYTFIFLSKPYEWMYRTMDQSIFRIYHLAIFFASTALTSYCIMYYVDEMLSISIYFSLNYFLQYWSFKSLIRSID